MTNGRGCEWHFLALLSVDPNYNGSWFSACDFTVERIGD